MILSYTMGKPPDKVNLQADIKENPQTFADWIKFETKKEQILNAFHNFGIIGEKDERTEAAADDKANLTP